MAVCVLGFVFLRPARAVDAAVDANGGGLASSDQIVRLTEMEVFSATTSALTQAPTDSKLDTLEPNSVISAQTINNQIAPTADYAEIAAIAPSVVNVETEGPGLSESKMLSMR